MSFVKWGVAAGLNGLGLVALFRHLNRKKVKILVYHGLVKEALPSTLNSDGLHLPARSFARHIAYLARHYRVISLKDLLDALQGLEELPDHAVVLTFDDGYLNTYQHAWPILQQHRVPATWCVTTSFLSSRELIWLDRLEYALHASSQRTLSVELGGETMTCSLASPGARRQALHRLKRVLKRLPEEPRRRLMGDIERQLDVPSAYPDGYFCAPLTWDHLNDMVRSGLVDVGSHAVHHIDLDTLDHSRMSEEITQSKAILAAQLGITIDAFAYPSGAYTEAVKHALQQGGYRCGLTTRHGFNDRSTDLFELRRNEVGNRGDFFLFTATVSGVLDALRVVSTAWTQRRNT